MAQITVKGERGYAIHEIKIDHLGKEIGIPNTGLRNLTIRFNEGSWLNIQGTSDSELKLLGELLIKHADKGSGLPVPVNTEDRIIAESYQENRITANYGSAKAK